MEKEKEKIQELVNKMAANLLEQGIILSEAVKKQVCEDLCKDASSSIRAEQRTLVKREVGLLFSGLEKHFDFSFKESVKCNVEQSVLADVGLLGAKKSNEASLEATSTTETEETQVSDEDEKDEVRSGSSSEETQVSDENEKEAAEQPALVEEAKSPVETEYKEEWVKLLAESRSPRPWTEQCDDPEIIRKVNEAILANSTIDEEKISRDADLRNDIGVDSLDFYVIEMEAERRLSVRVPDHVVVSLKTVGDVYDAAAYYVKQKKAIKRNLKSN